VAQALMEAALSSGKVKRLCKIQFSISTDNDTMGVSFRRDSSIPILGKNPFLGTFPSKRYASISFVTETMKGIDVQL